MPPLPGEAARSPWGASVRSLSAVCPSLSPVEGPWGCEDGGVC